MVEDSSFEKVQGLKELENVLECFERCLDEIWRDDMFSNFFITVGKCDLCFFTVERIDRIEK